jgi:hypothetical protein
MVSLSDQSLVPTAVSPRKAQASQNINTNEDEVVTIILDTNSSHSIIVPPSHGIAPLTQRDRSPSAASAYSSSVYSEKSSGMARRSCCNPETKVKYPNRLHFPENDIIAKHTCPVNSPESGASPDLLTPRPLQLSHATGLNLRRASVAHPNPTFLLDDSSSESKLPSPTSTNRSSGSKGIKKESQYDISSEFGSSESSESIQEPNRVRSYHLCILPQLTSIRRLLLML